MIQRKKIVIVFIIVIVWMNTAVAFANESYHSFEENPNVLIAYSTEGDEINEHVRIIDMLVGHFSEKITIMSATQLNKDDLARSDYFIYYGEKETTLSPEVGEMLASFTGKMVAIGHNIGQLGESFSFVKTGEQLMATDEVTLFGKTIPFTSQYMIDANVVEEEGVEIVGTAKNAGEEVPFFIRKNEAYYYAIDHVRLPYLLIVAEGFNHIFGQSVTESLGYIRLEDIHPFVDPKQLRAASDLLEERGIPYMVAVIPVYTNPETGRRYHLSDSPKLLKVLKDIQRKGASVVLHGYTHQFRLDETGEGFEFWDVENNMPIYHGPDDEVVPLMKEDFKTEQQYEKELRRKKQFEREYIEERLTRGVNELANLGLYPLAFEAPHYTISQNGYEVAADIFSTYVGQAQISDENWEIMTTSPYISKPTFLHGMTLLPETLGYVQPEEPLVFEQMIERANEFQFVQNGMISAFYHPYLGIERFEQLMDELESIPNVKWIDLKQMENEVRTDEVVIRSGSGEVTVDINYLNLFQSSSTYLYYHVKKIMTFLLWVVASIGFIASAYFIAQIIVHDFFKRRMRRGELVD